MVEKVLKGLALAAVFGAGAYIISKDLGTALLIALVMFMSMFVKPKQR